MDRLASTTRQGPNILNKLSESSKDYLRGMLLLTVTSCSSDQINPYRMVSPNTTRSSRARAASSSCEDQTDRAMRCRSSYKDNQLCAELCSVSALPAGEGNANRRRCAHVCCSVEHAREAERQRPGKGEVRESA